MDIIAVKKEDFRKAQEILAPAFGLEQVNQNDLLTVHELFFDPSITFIMLMSMIIDISEFFELHKNIYTKIFGSATRINNSAIFYAVFLTIVAYTPYETAERLSRFSMGNLNKHQRDRLKAVKRAMKIFYPELEF